MGKVKEEIECNSEDIIYTNETEYADFLMQAADCMEINIFYA